MSVGARRHLVSLLAVAFLAGGFAVLATVVPLELLVVCLLTGGTVGGLLVVANWRATEHQAANARAFPRPAPLLIAFLVCVPLLFGGALAFRRSFSATRVVLLVALTFVCFWYLLVVPLAWYHARRGEPNCEPNQPLSAVSVLVPAYDEAGYVGDCVEHLLASDYPESLLEVVVVDDGSSDETYAEASEYADRGVTVVRRPNGGKHAALNYGLLYASGEVIVTVDADALVEPEAIRRLVGVLQDDPEANAVAGNVKVANQTNVVTTCQTIDYLVSINVVRGAFDLFGAVPVVPGVLGAYRREVLEGTGFYDPDTLTEDFDATVKTLKVGGTVRATTAACAHTEAPGTWRDLYRQRLRWYRGNLMTLWKHRDAFTNPRFGALYRFAFPLWLLTMLFVPLAGLLTMGLLVVAVIAGVGASALAVACVFLLLQAAITILGVQMEDEDYSLVAYAPLFVLAYKPFLDLVMVKSAFDLLLGRELSWTSADRLDGLGVLSKRE
ncbi:glycosyltransferase [Halorussus halophilus]|uniref:glycosyltransferase n=1 Tax=Halorussus halophilus TaxID=2650975 RepID=UPI0013015AD2|nr:glycosyltransferase [Halorussus halophilus]